MSDTKKHIELAYGLLWHVTIDTLTSQGRLVSDARKALSDILTDDERGAGIAAARDYQKAGRGVQSPTQRALDAEAQVVDLARENARLRDALRKIRGMKPEPIGDTGLVVGPLSLFNACQRIARAALKEIGK